MANVMSMKDLKNNVHRNGFDLSHRNLYTAKVGELLPVMCTECIPGDKFKIDLSWFTRTQPVNTAAFTRIREYYDFYFVPMRLMWRFFDEFFTQTQGRGEAYTISTKYQDGFTEMPYFTTQDIYLYLRGLSNGNYDKNIFGFSRSKLTRKLLQYLGYTDITEGVSDDNIMSLYNKVLNPFPLFAYQKIYQDYFRDSQWENSAPHNYNCDYARINNYHLFNFSSGSGSISSLYSDYSFENCFDLRYCNWNKDYFMGLLPRAQYGDEAVASPLTGSARMALSSFNPAMSDGLTGTIASMNFDTASSNTVGLAVTALRQAEFLQKWKEITQSGRQDYRDQIRKHFGVDPGALRSSLCEYVGGTAGNLNINEVVNTNLASSDYDADIAGKGIGGSKGHISYEVKEHGIFMCIYHAVPLLDWYGGYDRLCLKHSYTDFALPEMDQVGMQSVYFSEMSPLAAQTTSGTGVRWVTDDRLLGYSPRYVDYKTNYDRVHGEFRHSLSHWVAPLTYDSIYEQFFNKEIGDDPQNNATVPAGSFLLGYNYVFLKVNPSVLNSIFVVDADGDTSTDNLLCSCYFDFKAVRNLDYNGLPY